MVLLFSRMSLFLVSKSFLRVSLSAVRRVIESLRLCNWAWAELQLAVDLRHTNQTILYSEIHWSRCNWEQRQDDWIKKTWTAFPLNSSVCSYTLWACLYCRVCKMHSYSMATAATNYNENIIIKFNISNAAMNQYSVCKSSGINLFFWRILFDSIYGRYLGFLRQKRTIIEDMWEHLRSWL